MSMLLQVVFSTYYDSMYIYWRKFTNATTIPQYFKENGYISIRMGKVFHPGAPNGNDDSLYSWSPEGLPYYHSPVEKNYTAKVCPYKMHY